MSDYYSVALNGERLRQCYDLAPPRVRQYLEAEIRFVLERLRPSDTVLELGCGYGRVTAPLAGKARLAVGIDTSRDSLRLARILLPPGSPCRYAAMDAVRLGFRERSFDLVACVQNGVCAFHTDPARLLAEALRVVRSPGRILFSTYTEAFWPDRLEWFRRQAAEGLVGPIDEQATRPGTIVCRDGFAVGTLDPETFITLVAKHHLRAELIEVDQSSLFCQIDS